MSDLSPQAQRVMQLTREALSPRASEVAALRAALEARLGPLDPEATKPAGAPAPLREGAAKVTQGTLLKLAALALFAGTAAFGAVRFGLRAGHDVTARPASNTSWPSAAAQPATLRERVALLGPAAPSAQSLPPRAVSDPAPQPTRRVHSSRQVTVRAGHVTQPPATPAKAPEPPASAPEADDSLGPELALLREARAALDRKDPRTALRLLNRHAQRYPTGTLQQERLAARALALCALGRSSEASAAVHELARVAPGSPYLANVRAGCHAEQSK
jgi:hypothetical protein